MKLASLVLLATAVLLWSGAGVARLRLAALGTTTPGAGAFRSLPELMRGAMASPRLLPLVLAGSVGTLLGVWSGWPEGLLIGSVGAVLGWWCASRLLRRTRVPFRHTVDRLGLAATWDLLAACLRAGLPVPTAIRAVADGLPTDAGAALRASADLLALGADPVAAWAPALDCADTAELARGARRSARSGAALAEVAVTAASAIRESATDAAEARAQRAGVLITAPLGLCFLPAFLCLGIVPVIVGLAGRLAVQT